MTLTLSENVSGDKSLTPFLPRTEESSKKAAVLDKEIKSSPQKTDIVFKKKVEEIKLTIRQEKQKCMADLLLLNGAYYQDPKSVLKMAWDQLVESVNQAIGVKIERADQLQDASAQLKIDPAAPAKLLAIGKIDDYKEAETLRNDRQAQLHRILATEKIAENPEELLKQQKELLKQKHQKLCGNYFGDPQGELDKAWQKYQTAITHGSTGELPLAAYQKLEADRKQIEAKLYEIEQQLSVPPTGPTFEQLASDCIEYQIQEFKALGKTKSFAQINLNSFAAKATQTALINAGYIPKKV